MSAPSQAERLARQRNLLFVRDPRRWPAWPFLPLVRRRAGCEEEYGLLYDAKGVSGRLGHSATVFVCNLFLLPGTEEEILALPREVHDTPEEVAEAGWTVD